MSAAEQIIAKALREHGAPTEAFPDDEFDCCAEEVVAALRKAGMEIVQLPEPNVVQEETELLHAHQRWTTGIGEVTALDDGTISVGSAYHYDVKPDDGESFGLAILAATATARAAGGTQGIAQLPESTDMAFKQAGKDAQ